MKDLENVTVHYKNLETVVIKPEHVIDLKLFDISTVIQSVGDVLISKKEVAEYIVLQVGDFENEESNSQSELYSNISPYEKLTQDTTVVSITLNYKEGDSEEIHVPYIKKHREQEISKNTLLNIKLDTFETFEYPKYEHKKGVELEFNPEAKPY